MIEYVIPNDVYEVEFIKAEEASSGKELEYPDITWSQGYPVSEILPIAAYGSGEINLNSVHTDDKDRVILIGNNKLVSFAASFTGTRLHYKWQYAELTGGPYSDIPGQTRAELDGDSSMLSGFYRCEVSSSYNFDAITTDSVEIWTNNIIHLLSPVYSDSFNTDDATEAGYGFQLDDLLGAIDPSVVPKYGAIGNIVDEKIAYLYSDKSTHATHFQLEQKGQFYDDDAGALLISLQSGPKVNLNLER